MPQAHFMTVTPHSFLSSLRNPRIRPIGVLLVAGLLAVGWFSWTGEANHGLRPLTIESAKARHLFQVEIANSPDERQRGLMFRQTLPQDHGMLFVHERPDVHSMWMLNTAISLDMLFIDAEGVIRKIVPVTVPFSRTRIASPPQTLYVLEIRAGRSQALGIRIGDRITPLPQPPSPTS